MLWILVVTAYIQRLYIYIYDSLYVAHTLSILLSVSFYRFTLLGVRVCVPVHVCAYGCFVWVTGVDVLLMRSFAHKTSVWGQTVQGKSSRISTTRPIGMSFRFLWMCLWYNFIFNVLFLFLFLTLSIFFHRSFDAVTCFLDTKIIGVISYEPSAHHVERNWCGRQYIFECAIVNALLCWSNHCNLIDCHF